jgi:REP element-mobilizing transposase RayT
VGATSSLRAVSGVRCLDCAQSRSVTSGAGGGATALSLRDRWLCGDAEHVHLLLGEPERGNPSVVMQALKQSFARRLLRNLRSRGDGRQTTLWSTAAEEGRIWQHRFYDFVVFTEKKRVEKINYMHHNPVRRGLVLEPEQWAWSSFRHYAEGEPGLVLVNEAQKAELRIREIA